jgi:hypothetical protein
MGQTVAALPSWADLARRQLDLRGRAAAVLGRFPGDDVAGELRAFRPGMPALNEARARLEAGLTRSGIDAGIDVEATASLWLQEQERYPPIDHSARLAELSSERDTVETDLRAQAAELVAIAARLRDLDRRLGELAVQEARLTTDLDTDLEHCAPEDVEQALHEVLDEFIRGERVPGRLPIVVAGADVPFVAATRERTLRELERTSEDLQIVVVVDDTEVESWAQQLGPDASVWSPQVAAQVEAEERARREAELQALREAEQRAVREAEERARQEADAIERREAEERARTVRPLPYAGSISPGAPSAAPSAEPVVAEPSTAPPAPLVDLSGAEAGHEDAFQVHTASTARVVPPSAPSNGETEGHVVDATEEIDAREPTPAGGADGNDDWWVPIVSRPGATRATRPVGEDLAQRRRRAEQLAADGDTTMHCDVHRNHETSLHCARCALPYCEHCLALLGDPPALHCVDCALELSGARTRGDTGNG